MSRRLADGFLDALGAVDPDLQVDTLDVWAAELPEFDAAGIGVKYKRVSGEALSESEARVGAVVDALVERFRAADRIVVGVPMWNWSLPYKLKQLIDLVCQRGGVVRIRRRHLWAGAVGAAGTRDRSARPGSRRGLHRRASERR